ncbi:hypothetical protein HAX54_043812 [Datura stramonium]|uniref:Uncharacterized protein n=1 Tax=Datura stramonium TaxID=4076 RepID=A0ABS8RPK7_DATST|nr:hypothetical protein [Datura stramonium]
MKSWSVGKGGLNRYWGQVGPYLIEILNWNAYLYLRYTSDHWFDPHSVDGLSLGHPLLMYSRLDRRLNCGRRIQIGVRRFIRRSNNHVPRSSTCLYQGVAILISGSAIR